MTKVVITKERNFLEKEGAVSFWRLGKRCKDKSMKVLKKEDTVSKVEKSIKAGTDESSKSLTKEG